MKKGFKKILASIVSATLIASSLTLISSAASLTSRSDFIWGVNGHNSSYSSYPADTLEKQISLAAGLGVKYYRFNLSPQSTSDFSYLDNVVSTADRYGMKIFLTIDNHGLTVDQISTMYANVAKRYSGRIPYIQVFNEVDLYVMNGGGDGVYASDYNSTRLAEMLPKIKAAINALNTYAPDMKTVINISYRHTYLFTWLKANGVNWDITGVDWYKNMGYESGFTTGGYDYIIPKLQAFGKDIFICETNIWLITKV